MKKKMFCVFQQRCPRRRLQKHSQMSLCAFSSSCGRYRHHSKRKTWPPTDSEFCVRPFFVRHRRVHAQMLLCATTTTENKKNAPTDFVFYARPLSCATTKNKNKTKNNDCFSTHAFSCATNLPMPPNMKKTKKTTQPIGRSTKEYRGRGCTLVHQEQRGRISGRESGAVRHACRRRGSARRAQGGGG